MTEVSSARVAAKTNICTMRRRASRPSICLTISIVVPIEQGSKNPKIPRSSGKANRCTNGISLI